jgi:hypothetical protein
VKPGQGADTTTAWTAASGKFGWSRVASGREPVTIITGRSAKQLRDRPMDEEMLLALMGQDRFDGTFGGGR